ncbi:MAG TPA: response regulator [Pseudomonas sp.]|nr:response regulator [Pseudomonas sp.]
MFTHFGIKGRVLLLTLLPTSLLALLLGIYFTTMQFSDLRYQLLQRGQMVAEHLAPLTAPALPNSDPALLQRIANKALEQPDVRAVTLYDQDGQMRAHAGPNMLVQTRPINRDDQPQRLTDRDTTRFVQPILVSHLTLGEPTATDKLPLGWIELEISHQGMLLRGYRSLFASLLLIIACLGVAALLALRMSRAINTPLSIIQKGVARLKDGDLQTRLPDMGSREMDHLAAGINRMAAALQNAQEELQHNVEQATEDVRQNLETIEIQNIELDLARKEALEASRIKSEFLANMSHEIRTPLNGILGFTRLLLRNELTPRQRDYLQTIQKSANNLLGIINEILDFSKIEAGKLVLENAPFNLRDLLQDTLTMLAPEAHGKQLELVSLIYRDTPQALVGDSLRLKQVLTNLVSNAIKFTHQGTVAVRAMLEDEDDEHVQLRISVTDTGIGLSEEDLRQLFHAFSQADNSISRQAGGTGLGLVISKRLVEQMGGEIGVESTPGQGSDFWISLSLPKAEPLDEVDCAAVKNLRVALLDGHDLARQALRHQLEDAGLEVLEYASANELLEAVANLPDARPIDLAVLSIDSRALPPERLGQYLHELEAQGCKSLVLCPTTDQMLYQQELGDDHRQLFSKPICTRQLHESLCELLGARPSCRNESAPVPSTQSRPPRLLCVDDNLANLLLVETLLNDLGAKVTAVDSGFAALDQVRQHSFDLIFMDVQMPGMDGLKTTEAIRAWETEQARAQTPIVALTAHALANERRALLQGGMDDYLTKPINEHQLSQVVLKWTGLTLRGGQPVRASEPVGEQGSLPVLDHDEGLRLAAGKADLAADMLAMLLDSLEADRQAILIAWERWDREALIERIHRLHGATRYCGVPQLRAACQRSETLLKQDAPEARQSLDVLVEAIQRLSEASVGAQG